MDVYWLKCEKIVLDIAMLQILNAYNLSSWRVTLRSLGLDTVL